MEALGMFEKSFVIDTVEKIEMLYNFTVYISLQPFENIRLSNIFGKFLIRGVPRKIVSRATLGTRAIGSPPLV